MNGVLETVVQAHYSYYVNNIHPKELITPMRQVGILKNDEVLDLLQEPRKPDIDTTHLLLGLIIQRATVDEFIQILRFEGVHSFVADAFECQKRTTLFQKPPRVCTKTTRLSKVKKYALGLKQLIHGGFQDDFNNVAKKVHDNWKLIWSNPPADRATEIQEAADQMFYTLDAQVEDLRVRSDPNMHNQKYFKQMEEVIKYTSEPHVSAMMYLVRYGSAIAYKESIDIGMTNIAIAIQHSESVHPCKETGMVYYIEINHLFRKYHTECSSAIKRELLNKTALAISHFELEDALIKEEYTRMLLLKQVYVYLGLGVYGEAIVNRIEEADDLRNAQNVLIKIKDTEWLLDKRRLMFLYIAEAILNERHGDVERALGSAKAASNMAVDGKFFKEKTSIDGHILRIQGALDIRKVRMRDDALRCVNELLPDFTGINRKDKPPNHRHIPNFSPYTIVTFILHIFISIFCFLYTVCSKSKQ